MTDPTNDQTCVSCVHWQRLGPLHEEGDCTFLVPNGDVFCPGGALTLSTLSDFGCIRHELRPADLEEKQK